MTIKNIGLSVAAVALLSTAVFAGTVNNPGKLGLIGQEALSLGDLNVTVNFAGVIIKPKMYIYADNNGIILSAKKLSN